MNEALRSHVTSASFQLSLGLTHIAALVAIDHDLRRNRSIREDLDEHTFAERKPACASGPHRRAFQHNATGLHGLCRRGLVIHHTPTRSGEEWLGTKPEEIWEVTEAGRLVIALLKEAGLWAEYGGAE